MYWLEPTLGLGNVFEFTSVTALESIRFAGIRYVPSAFFGNGALP